MSDEAEDPTCSRCGIVLLEHEIADGHCADRSAVACRLRAARAHTFSTKVGKVKATAVSHEAALLAVALRELAATPRARSFTVDFAAQEYRIVGGDGEVFAAIAFDDTGALLRALDMCGHIIGLALNGDTQLLWRPT